MEEIIIRRLAVPTMSSNILKVCQGKSLCQIARQYGNDYLVSKIFDEKEMFEELQKEYQNYVKTSKSEKYVKMYRVSEKMGVVIDSHITLHTIPNQQMLDEQHSLFEWTYVIGTHYLGDTWWFSDEEILDDLKTLNSYEFIEKYRGIGM